MMALGEKAGAEDTGPGKGSVVPGSGGSTSGTVQWYQTKHQLTWNEAVGVCRMVNEDKKTPDFAIAYVKGQRKGAKPLAEQAPPAPASPPADQGASRFYECTQCWSLVREASRSDHEAVHEDQNKPRWSECSLCHAIVHTTQKARHRDWHNKIERRIRDLATGPRPPQTETFGGAGYPCESCGHTAGTEGELHDHRVNAHGVI